MRADMLDCNDDGYLTYDPNEICDAPGDLDIITLFYDTSNNKFIDEDGYIVWDIYDYITPNDLYLFRKKRECMYVPHRTLKNTLCELYYSENEDDIEYALANIEGGWSPRLIYSKENQKR